MSTPSSRNEQRPFSDAELAYTRGLALVEAGQHEQAFAVYSAAAAAGHPAAQVEAARMSLHGVGTGVGIDRALHWLRDAESRGSSVAGYYLAWLGCGRSAEPFGARMQARLLAAANAGYPPALLAMGVYFGRKSHPDDQALCMALLDQAAQTGSPVAAQLLAERMARGEGCAADASAADHLYSQLDDRGYARLPMVEGTGAITETERPGVLELADMLSVPPVQPLAVIPKVGVIDGLLSTDECRLLIAHSLPRLSRSRAVDPATGLPREVELRTSSDASHDPVWEDMALRLIQARMAAAAGVPLVYAERLTVLRYLPGEEYRPHRDYVPPGSLDRDQPQAGNRARTICVYLNSVEAGGHTVFPHVSLQVEPMPGRAVIFDNLHPDGRPDPTSLHAGTPVIAGEKWLATLWIRQRPYRDF